MTDPIPMHELPEDEFASVADYALLIGKSDCHGANLAIAPGPSFVCLGCHDHCAVLVEGEVYASRYGGERPQ